jgi:regulator of ribonuclease activity A
MKQSVSLPDLCDAYPNEVRVADPLLQNYGGQVAFSGPIKTIACFEDNALVAERVQEPGGGGVLVVDAGGSLRCGMLGDNLAQKAVDNDWAGIIIYGCIRDVEIIRRMPLGVVALATHPMKSVKRGQGRRDEPVRFAGIEWLPENYVYADDNGILVAKNKLA